MAITEKKQAELRAEMERLGVREEDLEEKFVLGSSKGGQKANKSNTAVQLKHKPTGIVIKCQKERSRDHNRFFARRALCERLRQKERALRRQTEE